jgi:hypothetical protein
MILMMLIFSIGVAAYTIVGKESLLYKQRTKKMNDIYFLRSFIDYRFQFSECILSKDRHVIFLGHMDTLGILDMSSNNAIIRQNGIIDSLEIAVSELSSHSIGITNNNDSIIDNLTYTLHANGRSYSFASGKTYGSDTYMNSK